MSQIRYLTAGESHGKTLVVIIEGFPSNLRIDIDKINEELARRQGGYGRGGRMKIEKDTAEIVLVIKLKKTFLLLHFLQDPVDQLLCHGDKVK